MWCIICGWNVTGLQGDFFHTLPSCDPSWIFTATFMSPNPQLYSLYHMKYAVQIAHVFIRKSSQPVKLMMKLIWDSSLRHYFTYQGQTYCVNLVDIKSHENVGDMQMFLLMGREDIFQAYVFNMLCVQLHMMLQSPWAPQSALCVVHRPTICPPFYPSLAF